jgi:transcription elongation factor Elf1
MEPLKKLECVFCGRRYYVIAKDVNLLLPRNIKWEAFPSQCPFCGHGSHAVLVDRKN